MSQVTRSAQGTQYTLDLMSTWLIIGRKLCNLKLFVYVIGLVSSTFSVIIQGSKRCTSTLFKVNEDEALGQIVPRDSNQTKLKPSRELSKVFKEQPPAETVSIIVSLPDGFGKGE